jgi:hypothetical protein
MRKILFTGILAMVASALFAQMGPPVIPARTAAAAPKDEDFVIKKPGEITFTSGIVIEGRVEKPQVMLILTKEKIKANPFVFQQSFIKNITDPIRYNTFEISKGQEETQDNAGWKTRRNQ